MRKLICETYYQSDKNKLRLEQLGIKYVYASNIEFYQDEYVCVSFLPKKLFDVVDLYNYDTISEDNGLLKYFSLDDLNKIKETDDEYLKAAIIVRTVFKDTKDKSGNPYINHLYQVSISDDEITSVAGLLHDIIEDKNIKAVDLLELGFSKLVVETIFIVTKPLCKHIRSKEEKLEDYNKEIDSIIASNNIHALRLKVNDMSNNYDEERLNKLTEENQNWFHLKYQNNLKKLKLELERRD